jgi:hypothetical protein
MRSGCVGITTNNFSFCDSILLIFPINSWKILKYNKILLDLNTTAPMKKQKENPFHVEWQRRRNRVIILPKDTCINKHVKWIFLCGTINFACSASFLLFALLNSDENIIQAKKLCTKTQNICLKLMRDEKKWEGIRKTI